jgi:Icc-related predicted phosphoesterase
MSKKSSLRIAAVGDVHFSLTDVGRYQDQFKNISQHADVLAICGDLTQHGYAREAEVLAAELKFCQIPIVGVLGNHDYEQGEEPAIREIMRDVMSILDEEPVVIGDVGFAGVKGFGGGFGRHMLAAFGETGIKNFVQEAVNESLVLERALIQIEAEKKVVVMHYSPIVETLIGEPPEIFPYLGCSRLAEPIDQFGATVVLHGHAHNGSPKGQTLSQVPVHNVALAQLENPDQPYMLIRV